MIIWKTLLSAFCFQISISQSDLACYMFCSSNGMLPRTADNLFVVCTLFCNFQMSSGMTLLEKAKQTIKTNYHGVLNVTNTFWSLLQPDSRWEKCIHPHVFFIKDVLSSTCNFLIICYVNQSICKIFAYLLMSSISLNKLWHPMTSQVVFLLYGTGWST